MLFDKKNDQTFPKSKTSSKKVIIPDSNQSSSTNLIALTLPKSPYLTNVKRRFE
jgi:hypothetical protein